MEAHTIQLNQELTTIGKVNNHKQLLSMTRFLDKMKEQSIVALVNKLATILDREKAKKDGGNYFEIAES